jgi:hypothetical protein
MNERIPRSSELEYQAYQKANESGPMFVYGPLDAPFFVQVLSGLSKEGSVFSKETPEPKVPEEPKSEE